MPDVVIFAGGKGLRIKKFTKNKQKCLIKINNKPFLQNIINKISQENVNRIFILSGVKHKEVHRLYQNKCQNFCKIKCIREEKPLGTSGALAQLKNKNISNFFLINGDTYFDIDYKKLKNSLSRKSIGCMALIDNKTHNSNKKLINLKIKKNKTLSFAKSTKYMNGGVYYFKKDILKYIPNGYGSLEENILPELIRKSKMNGVLFSKKLFIDIGTPKNLKSANLKLKNYLTRPAVFLDRDGVINHDVGYINNFKKLKFRSGVKKGLKYLIKKKYYLFIVTNQAGIAKNKIKLEQFNKLSKELKNEFLSEGISINETMFCPHHAFGVIKQYKKNCKYRKPGNKMILDLKKKWDIDFKLSFMIGDKKSDELCANKTKLKFFYAKGSLFNQIKLITKYEIRN